MIKKIFLKSLLLILALIKILSASTGTQDTPNNITGVRYSLTPKNIQIIVDFSGCPDEQFIAHQKLNEIEINIFNAKIFPSKFKTHYSFKDPLLKQITLSTHNIRQANLNLKLNYKLPEENIKIFTLSKPARLVIELKRGYIKKRCFQITPSILWTQKEMATFWGYLLINELKIDVKNENVELKVVEAEDNSNKFKTLSEIAEKNNALIAINGGFFNKEGSAGLVIIDGNIKKYPVEKRPPRTAFGITKDKEILIDRVRKIEDKVASTGGGIWDNVIYALGAGPRIIEKEKIALTTTAESFEKGGNNITPKAGRTVLGTLKNGELIFITFSGYRDSHLEGIKLENLAEYLVQLGVKDALNLDGGGSTGMWIKNKLVSRPPGGSKFERKIANAVLIYDKEPVLLPCQIKISPEKNSIPADGMEKINIAVELSDEMGEKIKDGTEIELISSLGVLDTHTIYTKDGKANFTLTSGRKPGKAVVKAISGVAEGYTEIYLTRGTPSKIFTEIKKIEEKKYLLETLITDEYLNPVESEEINFKVITANNDNINIETNNLTDNTGTCKALIYLADKPEAKIIITCEELEKEIKVP